MTGCCSSAGSGLKVGDNWEAIRNQLVYANYVVVAVALGLIAYFVVKWQRGRAARPGKLEGEHPTENGTGGGDASRKAGTEA